MKSIILGDIERGWYNERGSSVLRDDIEREFFSFHKHPKRDEFWDNASNRALVDAREDGIRLYQLIYLYYKASLDALDSWERDAHMRCPRDATKNCLSPGPTRAGGCCHVIPSGPTNFSVIYRNPGHWDIATSYGRAFRIRGEAPNVVIYDERTDDSRPHPRNAPQFKSVEGALGWCASQLMDETK